MHNYESVAGAFPLDRRRRNQADRIRRLGRLERPRPDPAADGAGADVQLDQLHLALSAGRQLHGGVHDGFELHLPERDGLRRPRRRAASSTLPRRVSNYGLNMGDWFVFNATRPDHAGRLRPEPQPEVRQFHRRDQQYRAGQRGQDPQSRVQLRSGTLAHHQSRPASPTRRPIPSRSRRSTRAPAARWGRATRPGSTEMPRRPE